MPTGVVEQLHKERLTYEQALAGIRDVQRKLDEYRAHQQAHFERFDQQLESCPTGPRWLQEQEVANIVAEAIRYRDKREYDLIAFCIMPNHVHMVFDHAGVAEQGSVGRPARQESFSYPAGGRGSSTTKPNRQAAGGRGGVSTYTLTPILESLKKYTALQANRLLGRTSPFWQHEGYDHVIRDTDELERTIWYVINNPVAAELVQSWKEWPWTYCKPNLL